MKKKIVDFVKWILAYKEEPKEVIKYIEKEVDNKVVLCAKEKIDISMIQNFDVDYIKNSLYRKIFEELVEYKYIGIYHEKIKGLGEYDTIKAKLTVVDNRRIEDPSNYQPGSGNGLLNLKR